MLLTDCLVTQDDLAAYSKRGEIGTAIADNDLILSLLNDVCIIDASPSFQFDPQRCDEGNKLVEMIRRLSDLPLDTDVMLMPFEGSFTSWHNYINDMTPLCASVRRTLCINDDFGLVKALITSEPTI